MELTRGRAPLSMGPILHAVEAASARLDQRAVRPAAERGSFSQLWAAAQAGAGEGGGGGGGRRRRGGGEDDERQSRRTASTDESGAEEEEDDDDEPEEDAEEEPAPRGRKRAKPQGRDDASSSEEVVAVRRPPRRVRRRTRKPTYLLQKEERETLLEEIRILEARADLLKIKSGLPTMEDKRSLSHLQALNFDMEERIHANLIHLGRCQGLISREIISTPVNPMKAYIHLPRNLRERRAVLRNMKDRRLRRAEELASERLHYLDHFKPYASEERFTDDENKFHCKRFDILLFDGLKSGRPVYDALLYYLSNVEISVTETLGHLTIREDSDDFDPTIWNHRVISRNNAGYMEDMNVVGFTRYYDEYPPHHGAPFGVVACDSVDADDLHPYVSSERVRKDITSAHTVSEFRRPDTQELVVVLKRCVFLSVHPPQFPLSRSVQEALHDHMTTWAPVMAKLIREKVYADFPDPAASPTR